MLTFYLSIISSETEKKFFEEIYYSYRKQMYTVAMSVLENNEDSEDAVHDVFCAVASKHIGTLSGLGCEQDRRNYLLKATKNTALNMTRKNNKYVSLNIESEAVSRIGEMSDERFFELICNRITYEEVISAIARLDEKYEDVLYMYYALEMPLSEIAQVLGRKLPTVKKQLARGRAKLLEFIGENEQG